MTSNARCVWSEFHVSLFKLIFVCACIHKSALITPIEVSLCNPVHVFLFELLLQNCKITNYREAWCVWLKFLDMYLSYFCMWMLPLLQNCQTTDLQMPGVCNWSSQIITENDFRHLWMCPNFKIMFWLESLLWDYKTLISKCLLCEI